MQRGDPDSRCVAAVVAGHGSGCGPVLEYLRRWVGQLNAPALARPGRVASKGAEWRLAG